MQNQLFNFGFFSNFQSRYRFLIKLIFLVTATFLCGSLDTPAQKIRKDKRSTAKIVAGKVLPKLPNAEITGNDVKVPISIVNQSEADYLSGEASVAVNPKQPTVVRLGLAQNAVSVVEFPASDGVYYIHEGNPKLVSVFQSPTKESDRSITIYPGESFVVGQKEASATITLQMRSGLILILEFVPVAGIRHNAHRCVISYNREEVISARRAAGLAFNLGEEIKPQINKNTRANSKLVGITSEEEGENKQTEESQKTAEIIPVKLTQTDVNRGRISRQADEKSNKQPKIGLELSRIVNRRLADCLKNPVRSLGEWSKDSHGLSLAVSPAIEIDAAQRLVIVAVRNNSTTKLRLVPGTPELQIVTVDGNRNPLQTERLERIYVETTSFEGLILPGSTSYYALVYQAPVIGTSQRLRILVSHREAADAPAATLIPGVNPTKD